MEATMKMSEKAQKSQDKKCKKSKGKTALKVLAILLAVLLIVAGVLTAVNVVGLSSNRTFVRSLSAVAYDNQLQPVKDEAGRYTFVTDGDFKILQLTDIHIGGGFMSIRKDSMALNAVAAMITAEQPDLVIVTGDITYPVPVQAGTFNNKENAKLFADLMEQLGVYWAPVFGNHDSESYSYYPREEIGALYESDTYPHCLFQAGDEAAYGVGNYCINVKNTKGEVTQSLFMLDSNSYVGKGVIASLMWDYDCIHEDQIDWYEKEVNAITAENNGVQPRSLAFFHIPLQEMKTAYYEYRDNGFKDTENVVYKYGEAGEHKEVVFPSERNAGFFDRVLALGSTQGIFFGHDHLNNLSLEYKGVRMSYGYSVDYLAYMGIMKHGAQRGCTVITVAPDGSFDSHLENYYQDKYVSKNAKESVVMDAYYEETA